MNFYIKFKGHAPIRSQFMDMEHLIKYLSSFQLGHLEWCIQDAENRNPSNRGTGKTTSDDNSK